MFQVLILVCSVTLSPADCQMETALDVVRGPVVANEVMCGLHGQAYIAPTAIAPRNENEYVKIRCMPTHAAQHALQLRAMVAERDDQ